MNVIPSSSWTICFIQTGLRCIFDATQEYVCVLDLFDMKNRKLDCQRF